MITKEGEVIALSNGIATVQYGRNHRRISMEIARFREIGKPTELTEIVNVFRQVYLEENSDE